MLTMMMSIVHRITGGALYFGMLLLAWWLLAAASGPNAYATSDGSWGRFIGRLDAVRLHLGADPPHAGRHPAFDLGYRPRLRSSRREWLARATLFGSIALTLVLWLVGYLVTGGLR